MGSDGREYKWSYRTVQGQEWTVCPSASCASIFTQYLVVHSAQRERRTTLLPITISNLQMFARTTFLDIVLLSTKPLSIFLWVSVCREFPLRELRLTYASASLFLLLSSELLATLTIMRHIAQHNL